MGYLVCQNCGGYYKLKEGESAEDFVACECYGRLVYVESLEDSSNKDLFEEESVLELDHDSDHNVVGENDYIVVNEDLEVESEDEIDIDQDIDAAADLEPSVEEPKVKNRAYYRRYDYYSEPDIKYLKNLKDVNGLINALYYDDQKVKLEAAQALASVGDDRALEDLNKIINKEGGSLKLFAEIAVKQIQSRKYGYKSRSRDEYRQISSETSETPDSHPSIPEISHDEVSQDGASQNEITPEKPKYSSQDISEIHDEQDITVIDEGKDLSLSDDIISDHREDLSPLDHEKDVSALEDEIVHEEIKKKPQSVSSESQPAIEEILEKPTPDEFENGLKVGEESSKPKISSDDSMESEDILTSSEIETSELKESVIGLAEVESSDIEVSYNESHNFKVTETEPLEEVKTSPPETFDEQQSEMSLKSSEAMSSESNISLEAIPEDIGGISEDSEGILELSETKSPEIPEQTPSVTMKTVDDTVLSSEAYKNEPILDSKNSGIKTQITSVFKNSPTPTPTPAVNEKIVTKKPAPVLTNGTITDKKMNNIKNEEDLYFVRWLGIKNTDKQLIGFIIIFSLILIVGVILTMTQMDIW